MTTERLAAILSGLFGSLSVLLAAVGIFGVTAYVVSRRRAARIDPAVVLRDQ